MDIRSIPEIFTKVQEEKLNKSSESLAEEAAYYWLEELARIIKNYNETSLTPSDFRARLNNLAKHLFEI